MFIRLLFIALLFLPSPAYALEFSEIAFDLEGSDEGREWIELYNETETPLDLATHKFVDKDGQHNLIIFGQPADLIIAPKSYAILAATPTLFLADHPGFVGKIIDTAMNLLNYSATLTTPIALAIQDSTKAVITSAEYLPTAAMTAGYTLERQEDASWTASAILGGTPGSANSVPKLIEHTQGIRLSEIVPNPLGSDTDHEWVELENSSSLAVDISNWYITDKSATKKSVPASTTLNPGAFYVWQIPGTMLNNSDEVVNLYWPDGALIESITASGTAKDDWSFARLNDTWDWTDQLTAGSSNKPRLVIASTASAAGSSGSSSVSPTVSNTSSRGTTAQSKSTASQLQSDDLLLEENKSSAATKATDKTPGSKATKQKAKPSPAKLVANLQDPTPETINSPTLSATEEELPIEVARVAGITSDDSPKALGVVYYISLALVVTLFLLAIAIYKFKLLALIPVISNGRQSGLIT